MVASAAVAAAAAPVVVVFVVGVFGVVVVVGATRRDPVRPADRRVSPSAASSICVPPAPAR